MGALCAPHLLPPRASDWDRVYLTASARLLNQQSPFDKAFVYPPFAAILGVPFVGIGTWPARVAFWFANATAALGLIAGSWRLSGGQFQIRVPWREIIIVLLGCAVALGYTLDVFLNKQTDVLIAGGLVCGYILWQRGYPVLGTLMLGVASAVKFTPLLLVPVLFVAGRWRIAVSVALVAFAVQFIPDGIRSTPRGHLMEWYETSLSSVRASDPGKWHAGMNFNHSWAGLIFRFTHTADDKDPIATVPSLVQRGLTYLPLLVLFLLTLRRAYRDRTLSTVGFSLVFCLILLASPMSSKPHFCALFLPAWLLARDAMMQRHWRSIVCITSAALGGLMTNHDLVGPLLYKNYLWYGGIPLQVLALYIGCYGLPSVRFASGESN
jgi:hypothetical protein